MSGEQLDMFAATEVVDARSRAIADLRRSWDVCWDWAGPVVGGLLEVRACMVPKADGSGLLYCYTEQARVVEINGDEVLAVLEGNDAATSMKKDGALLRLDVLDVWAPCRALRMARESEPVFIPAA